MWFLAFSILIWRSCARSCRSSRDRRALASRRSDSMPSVRLWWGKLIKMTRNTRIVDTKVTMLLEIFKIDNSSLLLLCKILKMWVFLNNTNITTTIYCVIKRRTCSELRRALFLTLQSWKLFTLSLMYLSTSLSDVILALFTDVISLLTTLVNLR